MKILIIKWTMILSAYVIPFLPLIFINSSWPYWIGFLTGAVWFLISAATGDVFRKARLKEPTI